MEVGCRRRPRLIGRRLRTSEARRWSEATCGAKRLLYIYISSSNLSKSRSGKSLAPRSSGTDGSLAVLPHYYLGATELSQVEVWEVSGLISELCSFESRANCTCPAL